MKKFTSLCLSSLVCFTTVAAQVTPLKATEKTAKKTRTEAPKKTAAKGVKAPSALTSRMRPTTTNGLTRERSTTRLNTGVLNKRYAKPSMFAPAEDSLYGFLAYAEGDWSSMIGYCSINAENGSYTNVFPEQTYMAMGAGMVDGKVYATGYSTFWGMLLGAYIVTYDAETGSIEDYYEVDLESGLSELFLSAAFDTEEMAFYGTTFNASQTGCILTKYDVTNGSWTYLGDTDDFTAMTINQTTGALVGVEMADDGSSMLFEVNRSTGETEPICEIENFTTDYPGGLCYSPSDNAYIWNPNSDDWSALVAIAEDGSTEALCYLEGIPQFTALVCTETAALDPATPQPATLVAADFKDGSLSGSVTWTMPTESVDGNALSGEVNYTVYCDSQVMSEGTAQPGAEVTVDMTVAQGQHVFSLVPSVNGLEGRAAKLTLYVGNDTPVAPAEVTLTATTVEWSPVTTGIHSGYVEAAAVTYTVKLNGKVIAENISETSCPTGLSADAPLEAYVAEVTASCNGMTSAATTSNDLVYGEALQMPVKLAPTPSQAKLFTILNNNDDSSSWQLGEIDDNQYAFYYSYNSLNDADDWLMLPPVEINSTEELIGFQMKVMAESANYPERYEVKMGTAPTAKAMTTTLIEPTDCDWTEPTIVSAYTRVPEAGVYYIGIHCISDADKYFLYAYDFEVENTGITNDGPEKAENVTVKAAPQGALSATVTMTLPTKAINGNTLSGEVTGIVTSDAAKAQVSGQPGETVSVEVATVQGDNRLKVQTECDGSFGEIVYVNVYTGIDVPGELTDMTAEVSEDNLSAKVTWQAPSVGANGGYVAPTGITYWLCQAGFFGWTLSEEIGVDVYEYEVSVPAGAPQATQTVAIAAENEVGVAVITFLDIALGQPYELPAIEKYDDGQLTYGPVLISNTYGTSYNWGVYNPALLLGEEFASENEFAVIATSNAAGESVLRMPKFSTAHCENAQLKFTVLNTMSDLTVSVGGYNVEPKEVFRLSSVNHNPGTYNTFTVDLPADCQNNSWVYYEMTVTSGEEGGEFVLAGYSLRNMIDYDLAVTQLVGPTSAAVGEKVEYAADVENYGLEAMAYKGGKFTVTTADGKVVAEATVEADEMVDPEKKVQASFSFDANADMLGNLTVKFQLASSDMNGANDSASAEMTVKKGAAVVVTDLVAEVDPQNNSLVDLSWTEPSVPTGYQSFEDETPFELSPSSIGEFTNIDRDGADVYCWNGISQSDPGIGNIAFKAGAFSVINAPQVDELFGSEGTITAKDGEQMLIAFCPVPNGDVDKADDWLISPAVAAGSKFGFSAKPITTQYGAEVLEIAYSTGSVNPDDFEVLEVIYVDQEDWVDYEFTLPADATRFAIHYVSEDIFGIMIDAITFELANTGSVTSYEVYKSVNGGEAEMIGTTSETKYTATINSEDRNEFYVVPVLNNGAKGEPSNKVVVGNQVGVGSVKNAKLIAGGKGEIVLSGFDAEPVSVSTLDGKVVATGNTDAMSRINVEAGVYVVKAGKTVAKVVVK